MIQDSAKKPVPLVALGGKWAVIAAIDEIEAAVKGRAGTRLQPD